MYLAVNEYGCIHELRALLKVQFSTYNSYFGCVHISASTSSFSWETTEQSSGLEHKNSFQSFPNADRLLLWSLWQFRDTDLNHPKVSKPICTTAIQVNNSIYFLENVFQDVLNSSNLTSTMVIKFKESPSGRDQKVGKQLWWCSIQHFLFWKSMSRVFKETLHTRHL